MSLYICLMSPSLQTRANPNVNYGLGIIMTCQSRFINDNVCTALVEDAGNGEGGACMKSEGLWKFSKHSTQFDREHKTVLQSKVVFKRRRHPKLLLPPFNSNIDP